MDPLLSIFLRALIETLIEQLLPLVMAELKKQDLDLATEVDELLIPLSSIKCAVEGIERRQEEIKTWLHLVEMVVYDANDLLDEIAYEIQRVNHIEFFPKVRGSPLNLHRKGFKQNASNRLRNIKKKLSDINDQRLTQILLMGRGLRNNDIWSSGETSQQQTDCFLTSDRFFCRSGDLQAILDLMSVKHSTLNPPANFDVISIHGMTGVGKTTLAKMVFNDERVQRAHQFHVTKWVHTPLDSDVKKLFYSIMESLTGNRCQPLDLNTIQEQLRNLLRGKKYLLVFDDMSINVNNQYYWENLKSLLSVGADGSKVLVTTRSRSIALTRDVVPYQLNTLHDAADCRDLFNAFVGVHGHPDPRLKDIVERIVKKCRGLPMAVKNFTSIISSSSGKAEGHDQWDNINSLEDNAIKQLHLEISKTIPAHIRRCFAYCSTFPPGFHFKKEMLVQLWMAQDIVSSEEAGCEIFDYMFNWSIFDCLVDFNYYRKTQQTYVMHHWIHSTALLMADDECCHVVDQGSTISHRIRHISLVANPNNLKSVYDAKGLYSLLLISDQQNMLNLGVELDDLVKKLPRLRSLDLSNTNIQELPDSIGDLQHLRYLALRNTRIKRLPKSVEKLYNLQTLGLANCYELAELPRALKKFLNLKYLELHLDDESRSSALSSMPPQLSKLKDLRTLSRFVASRQHHCGVSELRTLSNLRGDLCISNLDCIGDPREAQLANLNDKTGLKVLELQWSSTTRRPRNRFGVEASVLEQLSPHRNLKELRIKGYAGDSFPAWMANPSTFSNIVTMRLIDCKTCAQLPPLGHLPTLQHLIIKGMDRVNTIDCSFCRQGETGRFPSLTKMHLENMPNLEEWISDGTCNLPQLRELIIRDCNNLKQISHPLQSLTKLEILRCSELHGLRRFPSLCSLDVRESGPWIWRSLNCLPSLTSMTLTHLPMVAPIVAMQQPHTTVKRFEFVSCGTPEYLPDNWLPNGLTHLLIKHCPNLRALPRGLHNHQTLVDLKVQDCEKLESLGGGMRYLVSLQSIHLSHCPLLSCLSRNGLPAGLQLLSVDRCPKLIHWIQDNWSWVDQVPSVLIDGDQIR